MPRLWSETIEEHRHAVREAVLEAASALVAEGGLSAVTMTATAGRAGIGRATLYKYFPDVDAVLGAWHERVVHEHLGHLVRVRDLTTGSGAQLRQVLEAYALMLQGRGSSGAPAFLHQNAHAARAQDHLQDLVQELIRAAAATGEARADIDPGELASYCLHALGAAGTLGSPAAVRSLVEVVMAGLSPHPALS